MHPIGDSGDSYGLTPPLVGKQVDDVLKAGRIAAVILRDNNYHTVGCRIFSANCRTAGAGSCCGAGAHQREGSYIP